MVSCQRTLDTNVFGNKIVKDENMRYDKITFIKRRRRIKKGEIEDAT